MSVSPEQIREIRALVTGRVLADVPLSRYTSFKIGGPGDLVVEPANPQELRTLVRHLEAEEVPYTILGSGTNVLFHDRGFRGAVVRLTSLRSFSVRENGSDHARFVVAAGVPLPAVVSRAARYCWTGLEPLWGIPGSFGGAVVGNAGAGGACIGDFIVRVNLITVTGEELILDRDRLRFGYRSLDLPRNAVASEAIVRLGRGESHTIAARLDDFRTRRRATQPRHVHSAGCVFKNPSPEQPAGAIIDRLGFKGASVGDAVVSEVHANFIVNRGNARAADVTALMEKIREAVLRAENIELESEIRIVGEEPDDG